MNKSTFTLAIVLIVAFILSGCSFVRIQNISELSITVSVSVPDSGSTYTRNIGAGNIVDVFSANGGRYSVSMIPSESYRSMLETIQQEISIRLFEERDTLSADQVAQLVQNLNYVDQSIQQLAEPMPSCSGYLPDFDTVVVVISFDRLAQEYTLSCSSGEG